MRTPRPGVYIAIAAKISAARRAARRRALALPPWEAMKLLARFEERLLELDARVTRALLVGRVTRDEALAVRALAAPALARAATKR